MDYTIKDLPESERPREKLEQAGVSALTDVELLSIVLRTGISGKNVKELSAEILNNLSLSGLADRELNELEKFDGVSSVKAGQLLAVGELARRMKTEKRERIECLSDVKARVADMEFMEREVLRVFHLSSGNELLAEEEVNGGVDSVSFEPRKFFRSALRNNATAVVLAHNHPSRNPEPTGGDIEVTRELIKTGRALGVKVLDHVIVGETITSMRASSSLEFGN